MRNRRENNKVLIEKTLERCARNMCIRLRLGYADWDLDEKLRRAIETHQNSQSVSDLARQYDETLEVAAKSQTKIESKYSALKKLRTK